MTLYSKFPFVYETNYVQITGLCACTLSNYAEDRQVRAMAGPRGQGGRGPPNV